jgi:hypothetical protein
MTKMRHGRALPFLGAGIGLLVLSGCGGDDFANKPRPALPVELTGVIEEKEVTISPDEVGAGAVRITIANETTESHTVTLEGENVEERVGPINPQDAATINKTLTQGTYEVVAGSDQLGSDIAPGKLVIGPERPPSNDQLLQP